MINNFDNDFFNKNNRIKLCSIVLTGIMVASPFIVEGMANKAIDDLDHHNEPVIVQEDNTIEEDTSRITIEYEGDYNRENSTIIIADYYDVHDNDGKQEIIGIITPNADEPSVELPAGRYIVANHSTSYDIELDGETDYTLTVNYQDGSITNSYEKENTPSRTR